MSVLGLWLPPPPRHLRWKISACVDGGLSGGSWSLKDQSVLRLKEAWLSVSYRSHSESVCLSLKNSRAWNIGNLWGKLRSCQVLISVPRLKAQDSRSQLSKSLSLWLCQFSFFQEVSFLVSFQQMVGSYSPIMNFAVNDFWVERWNLLPSRDRHRYGNNLCTCCEVGKLWSAQKSKMWWF